MKKAYGVNTLDSKSLDSSEFFQLISDSRDEVEAFIKSYKGETVYVNKKSQLDELLDKYQAGLHTSRASKHAGNLDTADRERDDALTTLFALVKAFSRVKETATTEAYDKLSKLFKNYSGLPSLSYEKETEGVNHLLKELKAGEMQLALVRLHLEVHVESLKQAQAKFEKVYKERVSEQKDKAQPSKNKEIRKELQEIYDFLVDFTAINAYAYPEKKHFADLRDHFNAIRSRYKKHTPKKTKKEVAE